MNKDLLNDEILEGKKEEDVTSASQEIELNNASVPTPQEEENAGISPEETQSEEPTIENLDEEPAPAEEPIDDNPINEPSVEQDLGVAEAGLTPEKTFTQSQVDEIAGRARKEGRDKALRDMFERYGVNTDEELDNLFGDAQRYATVQDSYNDEKKAWLEADKARNQELLEVKEKIALLESGIDKSRFEDAKFILRGKGLEVTAENIANELSTHPEWKKDEALPQSKELPVRKVSTKIDVLGNPSQHLDEPELSEHDKAMNLFFRDRK